MEIDRLWDTDAPSTDADGVDASGGGMDAPGGASERAPDADRLPDRDGDRRAADCAEYRAMADAMYQVVARERWEAAKPAFRTEWTEHKRQHPAPPDASPAIDESTRRQVEAGSKSIRETEETTVTPAMHRIESADPDRHLTGLEHRRKGEDRILEKVAHDIQYKGRTPEEALVNLKDPIRYTFQYSEGHYTDGVRTDVDRLKAAGFEQVELRNSWADEGYKGINSRWRVPENGQLFEVQFHTRISFEAKQLTHPAYERLRNSSTPDAEQDELVEFQRQVNAYVPIPPGAPETPNYP